AGGEARVLQPESVAAEELQLVGFAASHVLALQEIVRVLELAGVLARVVFEPIAEEAIDAALQPHAAFALRAPELLVEAQLLAEDGHVIAADLGVAARRDLDVAHALEALGVDRGDALLFFGSRGLRKRWQRETQCQQRDAVRHGALRNAYRWC